MAKAPTTLPASAQTPDEEAPEGLEVDIQDDEPDVSSTEYTPEGYLLTKYDDGSLDIDMDPATDNSHVFEGFGENIAELMTETDLTNIATDLLDAIAEDKTSRADWEGIVTSGMEMLGLKFNDTNGTDGATGTISKVHHPLVLQATLRYQANAGGEMLPASGPVKVRDDSDTPNDQTTEMAEMLEKDMNHYLTATDKDYYPDFDRMLFRQGFEGCTFRKLYHCPIQRRPVSVFIPATDMIVSNDATSLMTAQRVTHWIKKMSQTVMKRLQLVGLYREVDLQTPEEMISQVDQTIKDIEGTNATSSMRSQDKTHDIYECICDLDLSHYYQGEPDQPEGLPIPYRVSIEVTSRRILEIRRYWKQAAEGDENDFLRLRRIVKYPLIPGFGFYDLGYIHILGNTNKALTAAERMMLDAGMYANFPGFLISKQGSRQTTNQIRIPPGGSQEIDTNNLPIGDVAMPLPYKDVGAGLMQLAQAIEGNAKELAGAAEIPVGEGKADIPVGTMIALVESSTKVSGAIHKRNHTAQQEEFEILLDLFREDPQALWRFKSSTGHKWTAEELSNKQLVPASDPNIPSHLHRTMQSTALLQIAMGAAPGTFNMPEVYQRVLRTIGIYDTDTLMTKQPPAGAQPPAPPPAPDPLTIIKAESQARSQEQQQQLQSDLVLQQAKSKSDMQLKAIDNQTKVQIAGFQVKKDLVNIATSHKDKTRNTRIKGLQAVHNMSQPQLPPQLPPPDPGMVPNKSGTKPPKNR